MDTHAAHDSKSANSSDEESEMNQQQAFVDQTKVFEEMKLLLTTQQESLKHNLDFLQTKAITTTTTRGIKPTKVNNKKSAAADNIGNNSQTNNVKVINTTMPMLSDHQSENVTEHIDSGHGRQWSHSTVAISGKNREDIQICPICAAEFDDPENPGALEEHVAGHWSTDNN